MVQLAIWLQYMIKFKQRVKISYLHSILLIKNLKIKLAGTVLKDENLTPSIKPENWKKKNPPVYSPY